VAEPLVAVLWLNYNSSRILDVVAESLDAIASMDYGNYVLVAVDNASSDGSWEAVARRIEEHRRRGLRALTLRLPRNTGFTGGMNAAYRVALRLRARYVAVLNNDTIPTPGSIRSLVEAMESHSCLGAVQGVLLNRDGTVQTAGNFHSELLTAHMAFYGRSRGDVPARPYPVTYASGAYALYRVDAVRAARRDNRLYDDSVFAYFDDNALGLALWGAGYASALIPITAGMHLESATFRRQGARRLYYTSRGHLLAAISAGTRYLAAVEAAYARKAALLAAMEAAGRAERGSSAAVARALRDYRRMAGRLHALPRIRRGYRRAPLVAVKPQEALAYAALGRPAMGALRRRLEAAIPALPGVDELCTPRRG